MVEMIVIGFVVLLLGVMFFGGRRFTPPATRPSTPRTHASFEAAPSLFVNRSELAFFHALRRALPAGMSVHSKVRLEDIVGVKRDIKDPKLRWHLRARVKSRHVDFLIIDDQGRPRLAIELDGDVHQTKQTNNADALKDGIFKACGIPLIRVRTGEPFHMRVKEIVMDL